MQHRNLLAQCAGEKASFVPGNGKWGSVKLGDPTCCPMRSTLLRLTFIALLASSIDHYMHQSQDIIRRQHLSAWGTVDFSHSVFFTAENNRLLSVSRELNVPEIHLFQTLSIWVIHKLTGWPAPRSVPLLLPLLAIYVFSHLLNHSLNHLWDRFRMNKY